MQTGRRRPETVGDSLIRDIAQSILEGERRPYIVQWCLTTRCNIRCGYCGTTGFQYEEVSPALRMMVAEELVGMGTRKVSLTGGEPLLVEDLEPLIRVFAENGVRCSLVTNGTLVPRRIAELGDLSEIQVTIDGPPEIHDRMRREGAYRESIEGIRCARGHGLNLTINTTITKYNLSCVDYILSLVRGPREKVRFQPVNQVLSDSEIYNSDDGDYGRVIGKLIEMKRGGDGRIDNSLDDLLYLERWPRRSETPCYAGETFFRIQPNGDVIPCNMVLKKVEHPANIFTEGSVREAIGRVKAIRCSTCWCSGTLRLNNRIASKIRELKG